MVVCCARLAPRCLEIRPLFPIFLSLVPRLGLHPWILPWRQQCCAPIIHISFLCPTFWIVLICHIHPTNHEQSLIAPQARVWFPQDWRVFVLTPLFLLVCPPSMHFEFFQQPPPPPAWSRRRRLFDFYRFCPRPPPSFFPRHLVVPLVSRTVACRTGACHFSWFAALVLAGLLLARELLVLCFFVFQPAHEVGLGLQWIVLPCSCPLFCWRFQQDLSEVWILFRPVCRFFVARQQIHHLDQSHSTSPE